MLTYELALQLKDAGFPGSEKWKLGDLTNALIPRSELDFQLPTLPELIEACGDNFASLQRKIGGYSAFSYRNAKGKPYSEYGYGKTPEEAVAKLYLAIHDS